MDKENIKGIAIGAAGLAGIVAGAGALYFAGIALSTLVGAAAGQVCDWIPYVSHAIPEGIAYVANAFTEGDTVQQAKEYLEGNLEKVGAAAGFAAGYFRPIVRFHGKDNKKVIVCPMKKTL